ncbi:MAG: hypothetical protein AB7U44_07025 [Sulfuricurvum sp.]|uniref:hypothetical protein n=1 Tax=Sulfuricurvum sp. TaxID=2025608 RepID=UPI002607B2C2|nr:hypothetical protein [Sulfuricurvum sp.]MDD2838775.1 hypothetical protein [Sulfuricurvum sp.]MDD3598230.1 hypothetical protein [Sulfuricurvum sp.]MDD4884695.1 hypothetical protein [Sulfuricurvum sp.]
MNTYRFTSKRLLASALITTGLLGTAPVIGDELLASESLSKIEESISPKIESELCNHRFQCRKTGLIVHFLPDSKALFVHPESALSLKADYTVHFNRSMTVSVYENPSNHFDLMMHDLRIGSDGFAATINRESRFFQKV